MLVDLMRGGQITYCLSGNEKSYLFMINNSLFLFRSYKKVKEGKEIFYCENQRRTERSQK